MNGTVRVERAKTELAKYLETRAPEFHTLTERQAKEVLSIAAFRVWFAWALLEGVV